MSEESLVQDESDDAGAEAPEVAALKLKLVHAELKAAAIKAGIVDVDAIRMIDMSTVRTTESGELVDGAGVMRTLRAAKPYLFGSSSSSVAIAPRVAVTADAKPAMAMSADEWRRARSELLRRR